MADEELRIHSAPVAERGTGGRMRATTLPGGAEGATLRKEAHALRQAEGLSRKGHRLLDLGNLERTDGGLLVDTQSHELWRHAPGEPRNGRPTSHAFGLTDSHEIRWVRAGRGHDRPGSREGPTRRRAGGQGCGRGGQPTGGTEEASAAQDAVPR